MIPFNLGLPFADVRLKVTWFGCDMLAFTVALWDFFLQLVPRVLDFVFVAHTFRCRHIYGIPFVLFVRPFVKHGFATTVTVLGAKKPLLGRLTK